jgi:hypothetical protein
MEQASGLLVKSNDKEELTVETKFSYDWDGCVEHRFKKKPATKFRGDNAWVVEYLLDRFATQACRDLCDTVCTRLPQEIRDIICSYLYKPLTIEVALKFYDKERRCLARKRQLPWIQLHDRVPYLQLCKEYCSPAFTFNADAFPGRWNSSRIPSDFVTRIEANITCDEWCTFMQSANAPRLEKSRDDMVFHLEFLLGFPPGTIVKLYLHAGLREDPLLDADKAWIVDRIVPIILPTLDRYRTSGYLTIVVIKGHDRNFVVDEYLSLAEWKAEFAAVRIVDTTNTSMLTSAAQAG